MIDPGHGGSDHGAVYDNNRESQIVLKVGQKLKQALEKRKNIQADLTRNSDISLPLSERVKKSLENSSDLFLSLHANAALDPRARGFEFFIHSINSPMENEVEISKEPGDSSHLDVDHILADLRQQHRRKESARLAEVFYAQFRGNIKQGSFHVLAKTPSPAVLVEIGFLSHPEDSQKLREEAYQNQLAEKLAQAIVEYSQESSEPSSVLRRRP